MSLSLSLCIYIYINIYTKQTLKRLHGYRRERVFRKYGYEPYDIAHVFYLGGRTPGTSHLVPHTLHPGLLSST